MLAKLRGILAVALLGLALVLLGWAYWPGPVETREVILRPGQVLAPDGSGLLAGAARVTFQWPRWIRSGESAVVRVSVDAAAESEAAVFSSTMLGAQVESSLDVLGAGTLPSGKMSRPVSADLPMQFSWRLDPLGARVEGLAWLYLRRGDEQIALAAQAFAFEVVSLWGLSIDAVLWLGWAGLAGGLFLAFMGRARRDRSAL